MSFKKIRTKLIDEFDNNNFRQLVKNKEKHKKSYIISNNYNLDLKIDYPGYKSEVVEDGNIYSFENNNKTTNQKYNSVKYDYRVSLKNNAISHVNIVIDLYNKGLQLLESDKSIYILTELLFDLAKNGDNYNRNKFLKINQLKFEAPSTKLLKTTKNLHDKLDKYYNKKANENWSYNLDELANVIIWIVLQEDINYPYKRCEGRKMPFKRYLETLYCCKYKDKSIKEVIKRTLTENHIPKNWHDINLNYSRIDNLW